MKTRKSVPCYTLTGEIITKNHKMLSREYHFFMIVTRGFIKIEQKSAKVHTKNLSSKINHKNTTATRRFSAHLIVPQPVALEHENGYFSIYKTFLVKSIWNQKQNFSKPMTSVNLFDLCFIDRHNCVFCKTASQLNTNKEKARASKKEFPPL